MSTHRVARVATLRGASDRLSLRSTGRFLLLLAIFFLGHLFLRPHISFGAVAPDFYLMATVFSALRWGALWGAGLGFLLGINLDAMLIDSFGMNGLALTVAGFAMGKMKESLYLDLPALDLILLFAAGLFTGLVVTLLGYHQSFDVFENRFFYEVPMSALYTALVGGALFRLVKR